MTRSKITEEVGKDLVHAFLTESPVPTERRLAKQFHLSQAAVHRFLDSKIDDIWLSLRNKEKENPDRTFIVFKRWMHRRRTEVSDNIRWLKNYDPAEFEALRKEIAPLLERARKEFEQAERELKQRTERDRA